MQSLWHSHHLRNWHNLGHIAASQPDVIQPLTLQNRSRSFAICGSDYFVLDNEALALRQANEWPFFK